MSVKQTSQYEASGGPVALMFLAVFTGLVFLMGYAGACQQEAKQAECEQKGGEFVWRSHSEPLCLPKGQVIPLTVR